MCIYLTTVWKYSICIISNQILSFSRHNEPNGIFLGFMKFEQQGGLLKHGFRATERGS